MRLPVNTRFLTVFAALLFGGFSCLTLLSVLRARDLMERQITASTLPLTSDVIVSSLEHDLLQPVLASGLMARNTFLEEKVGRGETDPRQLQTYLARIQARTGAITTFLVSERSRRYYHPRGVLKTVSPADPQDRWYFRFREAGEPLEINVDRDTADLRRTTAFINVRLQDGAGRFIGATGLGLDMRVLQEQLQRTQSRYGARILLVNSRGRIMLASDRSSGALASVPGLAPLQNRILSSPGLSLRFREQGREVYVRTNRIEEIGWTLVVLQSPSGEMRALSDLLMQNLVAALLISLILLALAQATLGREQQQLAETARTDQLSGLLNRNGFEGLFQQLASQARRRAEPLSLALIDIDHFKRVNDGHGHLVGDAVIRHVSALLQRNRREADPLFRWGGEEFLVLMPNCPLPEAMHRLDTIRAELARQPFQTLPAEAAADPATDPATDPRTDSGPDSGTEPATQPATDPGPSAGPIAVTLSMGLALYRPGESSSDLLHRADQALYEAKRSGRDRLCLDGDGPLEPASSVAAAGQGPGPTG